MKKKKMIAIITFLVISCFLVSSCSTETTTPQESIPYSSPSAKGSVLESPTQEMESPIVSFKPSVSQKTTPSPLSSTETVHSESHSCDIEDRDYGEWYIQRMQAIEEDLWYEFDNLRCSCPGLQTSGLTTDPLTGTSLYVDTSSIGRIDQSSDGQVLVLSWVLGTENFSVKEAVENNYEFVLCYRLSNDEHFRASVVSLVRANYVQGFCSFRMDGTTVLKEICAMQKPDQEMTIIDLYLVVVDKDANFNYVNISFPDPEEGELPIAEGRVVCWDEGTIFCKNAAFEVLNSWT